MANRSTPVLGALGATVPEPARPLMLMGALGATQRLPDGGDRHGADPPEPGGQATRDNDTQADSLKLQQQQVGLLEQHKELLQRGLSARTAPPAPGLLAQVGQTARDTGASLLSASGGYLAAKGIAQVPAVLDKVRGASDSQSGPDRAPNSASGSPGAIVLPALLITDRDRAPDLNDHPLGADATPAPVPRPPGPGRWAQVLQPGKSVSAMAGMDAAMKLAFTATTATTPEQKGEGVGAAAGGFLGAVAGAIIGGKTRVGAAAGSMMFGFAGDKLGGTLGKGLAATPGSTPENASPPPADAASPSAASTLLGTLAGATVIGAGAGAYKHRERLRQLGRGKGGAMLQEPYPLGADAGPSPTGINPAPGRWASVKNAIKVAGKLPWLEAGVKGAYTYATAKTPEEKGAGYGGAVGGAVGTVLGGALLSGLVGPPVAMLIGNAVGDKVGGLIGGWVGKTFFSPPSTSGAKPAPFEQAGTQVAKPASPVAAKPVASTVLPLAPGTLASTAMGKYFSGQADGLRPSATAAVPPAPLALPAVGPGPAKPDSSPPVPVNQQLTFTANIPITVQGSVDAPNQLAQQLEEAVKRVMQDLQKQAYNAQLADHPQPF